MCDLRRRRITRRLFRSRDTLVLAASIVGLNLLQARPEERPEVRAGRADPQALPLNPEP